MITTSQLGEAALREREIAAWRQLATLRPFDKITLCAAAGSVELIVVSVHAGDESDLRAAHICCAERLTRVDVTVKQPHVRAGFYWIRRGWGPDGVPVVSAGKSGPVQVDMTPVIP